MPGQGDALVSVDGRSIGTLRFSEVSALLAGDEGAPVALQFERTVRDGMHSRTRAYDVALKRERFFLNDDDADDDAEEDDDDASLLSAGGGRRARKADYWEGYRAAMSHKAPPFATSIASFESDDDDDDRLSDDAMLPTIPQSPSASDGSDDDVRADSPPPLPPGWRVQDTRPPHRSHRLSRGPPLARLDAQSPSSPPPPSSRGPSRGLSLISLISLLISPHLSPSSRGLSLGLTHSRQPPLPLPPPAGSPSGSRTHANPRCPPRAPPSPPLTLHRAGK